MELNGSRLLNPDEITLLEKRKAFHASNPLKYESKGPLGCIVLHFFQHAMRLAQSILTVLISLYQNTFQKLKIRIQRERGVYFTLTVTTSTKPTRP